MMINLLMGDRSELMCAGVRHCLSRAGFRGAVEVVHTECRLREQLAETSGSPIVLIDPAMSGDVGNGLICRIAQQHPLAKVVAFVYEHNAPSPLDLLKAGAKGIISKSAEPDELALGLTRVSEGRRYIGHQLCENLALVACGPTPGTHRELSPREQQVFTMLAQGHSVTEISGHLGLSPKTVSTHKTRLMLRMKFRSKTELIQYAIQNGIIDPSTSRKLPLHRKQPVQQLPLPLARNLDDWESAVAA